MMESATMAKGRPDRMNVKAGHLNYGNEQGNSTQSNGEDEGTSKHS